MLPPTIWKFKKMKELDRNSLEISEGIAIDYDEDRHITKIDIDNANHKIDLKEIILKKVPAQLQAITI